MKEFGVILFGGQNGINNIGKRIARANRKGFDLTKNWYELFLTAEDAPTKGKNYIPDIRILEEIKKPSNKQAESKATTDNKQNNSNVNYLMIKGFKKATYDRKNVFKIICVDPSSKVRELFLMPDAKQDILKLRANSIIQPISISTRENISILNDYKIVKNALNETKKAV